MEYTKKVLELFKHPKNMGELKDADGIGKVGNPRCGDVLKLFIKVEDNKIIKAKIQTYGCVAAIAAADVLCELVKGKTIEQALELKHEDIINSLGGLPLPKIHCSVLGISALKAAISDYRKKKAK